MADVNTWAATIPGAPVAQGRPRFVRATGRTYTPGRTASWQASAVAHLNAIHGRPKMLTCPVEAAIVVVIERPQRLIWKKRAMPRQPHFIKPDADNFLKAIGDAIEKAGILANDSQIWRATVDKMYASADEQPHVEIVLMWEA